MSIEEIVKNQRDYYMTGATRPLEFRLESLRKLQKSVRENEKQICDALLKDLNKHPFESYMAEVGMVLDEVKFHIRHLRRWIKDQVVPTPLVHFPAVSFTSPEPYGVALIMSPWNYPILLCLDPLIGAISAGNCAVIKPSAYTPATSQVIADIVKAIYPPEYITVVQGGRQENTALLEQKFDYIFFTGSISVGKAVMEAAAKHLTPVTLELGGKSPAIVDASADLKLAAKRIAFGKLLNGGQTCVVQSEHERFLTEEHFKAPVTVYNYPREIKPFYMRLNDDGKTVTAMDVLVPGIGEVIGGAQREERLEQLLDNMKFHKLAPEDYWWYVDLRRYGTVPHAGFGLGFERLLMFLTGVSNIRDVIPFARTPGNAEF